MVSTSSNVRVLARVRPAQPQEYQYEQATEALEATHIRLSSSSTLQSYESVYDCVLPDSASQAQVYGQSSGHGIVPRAVHELLQALEQRRSAACGSAAAGAAGESKLVLSYLETYNDRLYDLLQPYKPGSSRDPCRLAVGKTSLEVREDPLAGTHVPNLLYVDVQSSGQVLQLVAAGNCNRATAHTDRNQHSSRSHAILQFWLEQRPPAGAAAARDSTVVRSKLNFVDLTGSERWGKAHTEAEGGKSCDVSELTSINNSLSALAQVVAALTDRSAKHVPYRSSRLTHLLQDSLGGNCCTSLIVTLAPCADAFQESLATLRFADRARNIANRAVVNSAHDTDTILALKEREIQRLRVLLASYASAGGGLRSLDSLQQQQQQQQQQQLGAEGGQGGAEQQCVKEDQQQEPALQSLALLLPPSSPSTPFAPQAAGAAQSAGQ
ncbi:hypothetical protein OEZ85_002603 [Tetradesmus obliquus]|uniref:Kinesin motor domain-containing protein n=1 Tax=Tetradesmus obliquus TaxID=3088 RepID=A0ABY8TY27_TETOB|nr:hypothetical protein OEZ85_002603 [Tetradesmus obliquus]